MEILKYITAITRYYKLKEIIIGNYQTKRKTNIQISGKLSLSAISMWIIMTIFCVIFTMGTDSKNIVTVHNEWSTSTYNQKWWLYIIAAIIMMILTIIRSLFLFRKLEHKPLNLNIYQREKPSNLRPAHVRVLLKDGLVDEVSLAATLLDLIDRGYLSIEKYDNIKEKIFKNKEIVLKKTEKKTDDLLRFEKFVIEWFIDKYGNGYEISMKEIENRLKNNFDEERPTDLFEQWQGLVFLSFPLKKFYKEYRSSNNSNSIYVILTILGIMPIIPYIRDFRYIWIWLYIICVSKIFTK